MERFFAAGRVRLCLAGGGVTIIGAAGAAGAARWHRSAGAILRGVARQRAREARMRAAQAQREAAA